MDELKKLNNLTSNSLSVGQTLKVSKTDTTEPGSTKYYVVKAGDNLYAIARENNTTVDAIKRANNLTSNLLSIGQTLIIPTSEPAPTTPTGNNTYTVKKGDNLYAIARNFNTTVDAIKRANNLSSNNLSIGQVLIIPGSTNYKTYTVAAGDTLYGIAMKNSTNVDAIKRLNNLSSNTLSIGQKLLIP